jgi:hypothetical protein
MANPGAQGAPLVCKRMILGIFFEEGEMESNLIYKNHWRSYLTLDLHPYPASPTGKNPIVQWKDDLPDPTIDHYLFWEAKFPNANIWVKLGRGFLVIDPDGPEAETFVMGLNLPRCPTSISGSKSTHRWFRLNTALKPIKAKTGNSYLEVRTGEMGMLVAPSIHPETKRAYRWEDGLSPWETPFPELPIRIYEKIRELLPKLSFSKSEAPRSKKEKGLSFDLAGYLTHYGLKFRIKEDIGRDLYLLERCLFSEHHSTKDIPGDSSIIQSDDGLLTYQCFHNHCGFKTWADARRAISGTDNLAHFYSGLDIEETRPKIWLMKMLMRG